MSVTAIVQQQSIQAPEIYPWTSRCVMKLRKRLPNFPV